MFDLIHLVRKWLQPETLTGPQMVERVVMDRYIRSLPIALQKWVSQGDPKSVDNLVDLVERFFAAENLVVASTAPRTFHPKPRSQETGKTVPGDMGGKRGKDTGWERTLGFRPGEGHPRPGKTVPAARYMGNVKCFRCQEFGHMATNCPLTDEPMQCDFSAKDSRQSLYATVSCTAVPMVGKHMTVMTVNNKQITVLLDSGSLVTLIKANIIAPVDSQAKKVAVICVHGDTREYPLATVKFGTTRGVVTHLVGVVPHLLHDAIVGRDFPNFWELWDRPELSEVAVNKNVCLEGSSQDSQVFPFTVLAGELDETEESPPSRESRLPPAVTEGTLEFADLNTHKDNFGTEQRKDSTLARAWENVAMLNGEPVEPGDRLSFPYFSSNEDLLY